jgi:hypothetical protein
MNYKYCKHHDIDTIENPENFTIERNVFTTVRGIKYGPYKRIKCVKCKYNDYLKYLNKNKEKEKERIRIYNSKPENKIKNKIRKQIYMKNNKAHINSYNRTWERNRKKIDPMHSIKKNLRNRVWAALKGLSKSNKTLEILGCRVEELKKHLENKFEDGMNWDNYGVWHVDHIIGCANFDLSDPEQQRICFHYTNLQPMWGEKNIQKGSRLI